MGTTNSNYNPLKLTFANGVVATVKSLVGISPRIAAEEWGINRSWGITTSASAGLATVNIGYNGTTIGTGNANSRCNPSGDMQLLMYNSNLSKWEGATTATPTSGAGTDKQVTFTGLTMPVSTSFAMGNLRILAGAFDHLRARKATAFNEINWSTENEDNCVSFTVEGSKNGTDFIPMGTIAGHGTTNVAHNYSFMDEAYLTNLYRVRQNKSDGTSVLSANFSTLSNIAIYYPMTAQSKVRVILPNVNLATVRIKNAAGNVVYTEANILKEKLLDISALSRGTYTIFINQENAQTSGALIKQ